MISQACEPRNRAERPAPADLQNRWVTFEPPGVRVIGPGAVTHSTLKQYPAPSIARVMANPLKLRGGPGSASLSEESASGGTAETRVAR
jgi:hypothetical protein